MFWADKIVEDIEKKLKDKIASGQALTIRDEKTPSGRVHIGSMRGVAIHGLLLNILASKGIKTKFLYEFNDFDPMDGLPTYLNKKEYEQYMGKPLNTIPSPDGKAENFAEYFAQEFIDVIHTVGFNIEFYRSSNLYKEGKMNDVIRMALDKAENIRQIYKKVSGSVKDDDWYPLSVVCENCGKIGTTKVSDWDGEKVTYTCEESMVKWAKGCGHKGQTSPFDGKAKLPWKVEWPAKWKVVGVDIEGAGKDHSTKGGSRDIGNHIAREVFEHNPPYDIPYEFFLVGGAKMSSSKGRGSAAIDIAKMLPIKILRLVLLGTLPKRAINLDPEGDTIPIWFDWYDRIAEKHWEGTEDDDARLFELIHNDSVPKKHYLPRFSTVAFLVQMTHLNLEEEIAQIKEKNLTEEERAELVERVEYASSWLKEYAPDKYVFELQETLPEAAKDFSAIQKTALKKVLEYIEQNKKLNGQDTHHAIHAIRKGMDIEPKDFFSALYLITLGKDHGPKAGWFLSVLDRDFLVKRLKEVLA